MASKDFIIFNVFGRQYELPLGDQGSRTKEQILMVSTVLFATRGYAAVSMRDLASATGLKPASLYNHFDSKESLWRAVLDHSTTLYKLYFQKLDEALSQVENFQEAVTLIFEEPKRWSNTFTCYAFAMIQAEQFRDELAGRIFNDVFLDYSKSFLKDWFDRWIEQGLVKHFDTATVAAIIIHEVLLTNNIKVQELMGRPVNCDPSRFMTDLEDFLRNLVA